MNTTKTQQTLTTKIMFEKMKTKEKEITRKKQQQENIYDL